jgi:membrane associated rhomboid family serine protease
MIPIGDQDIRGSARPWVTWLLVGLNVIVFIYELTLSQPQLEQFAAQFGAVPARITRGENLISLLTSIFVHGGVIHILSNMVFLLVFGDNVEAALGKAGYLGFYLLGGLIASGAQVIAYPEAEIPSLGASGAVAAVLGAYVVMFPRSKVKLLVFWGFYATMTRVAALLFVGVWFITQFLSGITSLAVRTAQTGGVAYWAHIGGFIAGLLGGLLFRKRAQELTARSPSWGEEV